MLPRISEALTSFVAPVASSAHQSSVKKRRQEQPQDQKRHDQKQEPKEEPAGQRAPPGHLRLVKNPDEKSSQMSAPSSAPQRESVAAAFLQVFTLLREKRGIVTKWLGIQSYEGSAKKQKRTGRFRKGAMLDQQAG